SVGRAAAGECDVAETCPGTSTTCPTDTFKANGTICTDDGNVCTTDTCNGSSAVCQHPAGNAGTVCRAAVNECDLAESCTGTSTTCPADAVQTAGTACTDDGNVCTTDVCNGTVGAPACTHPAGNAGTVCRAAAGLCDVAETCTGSSPACPADGFAANTTSCTGTSQSGACDNDAADHCTGSSNTCVDAYKSSSTVCRSSAGQCDVAESCTGTSGACPADGFALSTTSCTGASQSGACDD